jgi:hypothetical protein
VIDVISEARKAIPEFQKDFWTPQDWLKKKFPDYEFRVSYSLCYPAIGDGRLDDSSNISQFGITDFELVVVGLIRNQPPYDDGIRYSVASVKDFTNFQEMALSNGDPKEKDEYWYRNELVLNAILLYTDEDILLAKYIRENFDELHKMSGENLRIFVVESPPKDSFYATPNYWKSRLEQKVYMAWSLLGWVRSKPYDETAAYDIARSLGIFPDELPCLVVFDKTDQINKVIFPIGNDLPTFFRSAISGIQRSMSSVNFNSLKKKLEKSGAWCKNASWEERKNRKHEALTKTQQDLFDKLRKSLKQIQRDENTERVVYNFFGQTVFINHPEGNIQFQGFQNEKLVNKEN